MTRILHVDYEKDSEYASTLILLAAGYVVDTYNDPVKVSTMTPSAIFLDLTYPNRCVVNTHHGLQICVAINYA